MTMSYPPETDDTQRIYPVPPPKPRRWPWIAASFLTAVAAVVGITLALTTGSDPVTPSGVTPTATQKPKTTATPAHVPYIPAPADFQLTVQVLEQKCFGSAGCNVTFRIDVGYSGQYMRAGEGPYEIVYTVAGTEDPFIGRFTLMPPDQFTVTEEYVTTPPGDGALTATVTQVI